MKDLVTGLKSFRQNNQHHSDLQPANIFVLDNKQFKLADSCFLNEEKTGFNRKYLEIDYRTPLSP
jgi:predicted unusual protein kinase regulating ubiquinone biosynthesis (AarF/ABC1/UbiB family)